MKKLLLVTFTVITSLILASSVFAITGPCSNCHTMHYSQNGTTPAGASGGPNAFLLLNSCLGCHTTAGAVTAPKVDYPLASMLAGGSFADAIASTDSRKHNLGGIPAGVAVFITTDDAAMTNGTPGAGGAATVPTPATLTCAGSLGCHGDGSVASNVAVTPAGDPGIQGFHHQTKGAGSFRFLMVKGNNVNNILGTAVGGYGSANWESGGATAANHNVYSAIAGTSISGFCANCHGLFHGTANTGAGPSAFVRHPTDYALDATMLASASVVVDYVNTPFGYSNLAGLSTTVALTKTNASVACVSCHRAHGSAQPDILRFDYATQIAGSKTSTIGCVNCHVNQR